MSNLIPKEGVWMEKELMVDLMHMDTLSVVPTVSAPSVSVVAPSVSAPLVVVITGVPHSDPVNPGAHSTPSLTFTLILSIISLKPVFQVVTLYLVEITFQNQVVHHY